MIRRLWFIAAALIVVMGVVLFYQSAAVSTRSQGDVPVYSSERYDPYGTAALRELLADRGASVRTLERPSLDPGDSGVLVEVLPIGPSSSSGDANGLPSDQLIDWMTDGNTVIQFSRAPTELMARMKIAASTQPSSDQPAQLQQFETDGQSPGASPARTVIATVDMPELSAAGPAGAPLSILLWSPMVFAEPTGLSTRVLARQPGHGDTAVALMMPVGRGKLIVIGAPTPALNSTLGAQGNLDFLLALIGNNPVILDEWSHGIGHDATIVEFIRGVGLLPLLIQVGFVVLLYVWSTAGHRRGDTPLVVRQRSSIEQIQTLGYLYSRSFSADATYKHVSTEVRRRLSEAMRCPPDEVTARAAALSPELRGRFDELAAAISRTRPVQKVPCPHCRYELYSIQSDRCPECGTPISVELRRLIDQASAEEPPARTAADFGSTRPLQSC